jgi:hypothetical protein
MDNLRAKKTALGWDMQKKTDSGKHIRQYKQGIVGSKHRLTLIMRTSCSRGADTLSDSGTVVPILEMHLEITHAIAGDIKLVQ